MKKVFYFFALVLASSNLLGVDSEGFVDGVDDLSVDGGGVDLAPALRQVFLDDLNKKKSEIEAKLLALEKTEEERQSKAMAMKNEVKLLEGQVKLLRDAAAVGDASQGSGRPEFFQQENEGLKEMASELEAELNELEKKHSSYLYNTDPGSDAIKLGFDLSGVKGSIDVVKRLSGDDVMKYNYFVRNYAGAKEHADLESEGSRLRRERATYLDPNSLQGQPGYAEDVFQVETGKLDRKIEENQKKVDEAKKRYHQNLATIRRTDFEKVPGSKVPVELERARAKLNKSSRP